jgi:hypothetical protein
MKQSKTIYSPIPLEDFKAHLGIDDREDTLAKLPLIWPRGIWRATGSVRGQNKEREHFEPVMPHNVRALLEPYRRRTILA